MPWLPKCLNCDKETHSPNGLCKECSLSFIEVQPGVWFSRRSMVHHEELERKEKRKGKGSPIGA